MNVSTSSSSSDGSSTLSSSSDGPIRAPTPIAPLKVAHENNGPLINDIPFMLIEKDVDRLYNFYQIPKDLFWVYAPNSNIQVGNQIPTEETIMVYEE